MLTKEENERFTRVGPGTPMGEMLRRYWHPVGCSEFLGAKPQRLKLLGEELVLYRGEDGKPALMELRCAHRGVALDYSRVEGDCIRCPYHGWKYDRTGQCVEQPAEPEASSFKDRIKLRSYPTQEFSGLVYGYLGPEPAPLLPLYDVLLMEDGVKTVQVQEVHANWFNHVENIVVDEGIEESPGLPREAPEPAAVVLRQAAQRVPSRRSLQQREPKKAHKCDSP